MALAGSDAWAAPYASPLPTLGVIHAPPALPISLASPDNGATLIRYNAGTPVTATTLRMLAISPNSALFTAQPTLPAGISGYQIHDLQPAGGSWPASQVSGINGGQLGGFIQNSTGTSAHAALWTAGGPTTPVDLHPTSGYFTNSRVTDVNASQAVGFGYYNQGVQGDHALLWTSANASSAIDLNPIGWRSSYINATSGAQQVGYGYINTVSNGIQPHALLWSGSAASASDLNPSAYVFSYAYGTDGISEAGVGLDAANQLHALIWAGSAASAKDINPTSGGFLDSRAMSVSGNRAGGYGTAANAYAHAIVWTALDGGSAVDVNPAKYASTQINAINSSLEVGFGQLLGDQSGNTHALLWLGGSGAYTDLNTYLPAGFTSAEADGIDASGNIVGWARDSVSGYFHAIEWTPVLGAGPAAAFDGGEAISYTATVALPEPGTMAIVGLGLLALRRRRRRSSCHST